MHLVPPGIMRPDDDDVDLMGIQFQYDNQTLLYGTFDRSAIDAGGFATSETPVKLGSIAFDFFVVKGIFDVLGIDPLELALSRLRQSKLHRSIRIGV